MPEPQTPPVILPSDLGLNPEIFPSFRPGQAELATRIALSPSRFPLQNAPCGSGKSLIYYTSALLFDLRLLILTPQKALQDQLMHDFGPETGRDLVDVRGQSNYSCPKYHNCEIGAGNECPLRRTALDHPDRCPNLKAIDRARASKRVVTNNSFWMTQGKAQSSPSESGPPPGIGTFDMIVIDEGHRAPEALADFCTINLIKKEVEQLLDTEVPAARASLQVWSSWAHEISSRIPNLIKCADSPRARMRLLSIGRDLIQLSGIASDRQTQWIYQYIGLDGKHTFSPVWATAESERLLFQGTKKVLLTSATLLPSIGKYIGIDPSESEYIDVANQFDPSRRPFIYTPSGVRLSYKSTPSDIRVITSKYDQIIDLWRGYKGLIHTQSYDLQDKFLSCTRNRHRMIVCERKGLSGADAIKMLKQSPSDMIVVGPALKEGHDLPDNYARFQIIAKMPVLNKKTDPVNIARCASIPGYEDDQCAISIEQMRGRIVRHQRDWGYTYTGDGAWEWVRKKSTRPESSIAAERWERERVPGPPKDMA